MTPPNPCPSFFNRHPLLETMHILSRSYQKAKKPVPGDYSYYLHAHQLVLYHPRTNEVVKIVEPLRKGSEDARNGVDEKSIAWMSKRLVLISYPYTLISQSISFRLRFFFFNERYYKRLVLEII